MEKHGQTLPPRTLAQTPKPQSNPQNMQTMKLLSLLELAVSTKQCYSFFLWPKLKGLNVVDILCFSILNHSPHLFLDRAPSTLNPEQRPEP